MIMTTLTTFAAPARIGRPIGSRPRPNPQTIPAFVQDALSNPQIPPPPASAPERQPNRKAGIWDTMTPDERSAYAKRLAAKRSSRNMARKGRTPGTPNGWTATAAAVATAAARIEAEQLVGKLQAQGTIAPHDKAGAAATIEALAIVRGPGGRTKRLQQARRLLRHYAPEMASLL